MRAAGARRAWLLLLSAALLAAGLWMWMRSERASAERAPALAPPAASADRTRDTPALRPPRKPLLAEAKIGEPAEVEQNAAAEENAEQSPPEGIQLFPRAGTKKIRVGLVVPENFELPPGYVRHYQTTDSGEALPAILMFHPLHPPQNLDIPIPEDRIVPVKYAPPGLPIEMLEVPANAYTPPEHNAP